MTSLINRALLKEQLKRFWVIAALPLLAYLLGVVTHLYNTEPINNQIGELILIFSMTHPVVAVASVLMPLVAALALFSFLFSPKAAVAFSAFPLDRKQLFFTNVAAGLVLLLAPLFILCLFLLSPIKYVYPDIAQLDNWVTYSFPAALFPNGVKDGQIINSLPVVAAFFGRTALVFVFYFAMFALAAVVSGHGVVAALICLVSPLVPLGVFALDQAIKSWMIVGHAVPLRELMMKVLGYSNALGWFVQFVESDGSYNPLETAVPPDAHSYFFGAVYLIIAAALLAAAYYCHRGRKQERTGESVVFNGLKHVLVFLLSMAGGIAMFVFFVVLFEDTATLSVAFMGFALGFVLAFFIGQMIAEKTFNVGHKVKSLFKYGITMAVMYGLVFLFAKLDVNGFQRWVPSAGEVTGVYITGYINAPAEKSNNWITDEEVIAGTVAAHKNTLSDLDLLRRVLNQRFLNRWQYNGDNINTQMVYYRLSNGSVISREYYLPASVMDGAGWHKAADLELPENIKLMPLPSYSPELNPCEHVWDEIREK